MGKLIRRRRIKGWRKPEGAISISGPSKWGVPSPWRNPFLPNTWLTAEDVTSMFQYWLKFGTRYTPDLNKQRAWILTHLHELAGDDVILMCRCGDSHCHGGVLLNMANELVVGQEAGRDGENE